MKFKLFIDQNCEEEVICNVHARTALVDELERLVTQDESKDHLTGYLEDEIKILPLNEIECFFVEDEKTFASYENGKKYLVKKRLYELEKMLPSDFVRINKSAIANSKKISKFKVNLSGAVDARFESGYTDYVSRRCFADLKRRFDL